jgi:chorismate mutase
MPVVRALRGATTIDVDEPAHIADRVEALVRAMLQRNRLSTEDLISLLFSATSDVHSTFPATAARARIPELADVPLMNASELDVNGALQRCIRVMAHAHTDTPRAEVEHVFLEGAIVLRPDLAGTGS